MAACSSLQGYGCATSGRFVWSWFAGTLLIFVITPGVTGFSVLTVYGEFLLKDIALAAAPAPF